MKKVNSNVVARENGEQVKLEKFFYIGCSPRVGGIVKEPLYEELEKGEFVHIVQDGTYSDEDKMKERFMAYAGGKYKGEGEMKEIHFNELEAKTQEEIKGRLKGLSGRDEITKIPYFINNEPVCIIVNTKDINKN